MSHTESHTIILNPKLNPTPKPKPQPLSRKNRYLRSLDLSENAFGDEGLAVIAEVGFTVWGLLQSFGGNVTKSALQKALKLIMRRQGHL